jgi:hypothetical protein
MTLECRGYWRCPLSGITCAFQFMGRAVAEVSQADQLHPLMPDLLRLRCWLVL